MVVLKKIRRVCGVKGCRERDSYNVSASNEFGASVVMCADCITGAYEALQEIKRSEAALAEEATELELKITEAEPEITEAEPVEETTEASVKKPKKKRG